MLSGDERCIKNGAWVTERILAEKKRLTSSSMNTMLQQDE
jgi:hypothetical protein